MSPKNILFGFCAIFILMIGYKFLSDESQIPSVKADRSDISTSDEYTIEGFSLASGYEISMDPINTPQAGDNLQPTPVDREEAKSEPVLAVQNIQPANLDGFRQIYSGVYYKKDGTTAIVRVDLNNSDVRFFTNPPNGTMTVCSYIQKYGLQLATNGGGFDINTKIPGPYTMYEGRVYSTEKLSSISLFITDNNKIIFAPDGQVPNGAKYAVSGFNRVVQDGQMLDRFYPGHKDYKPGYGYLKRRTSIGISGNWLNIVLFDSPITITAVGEYHLATFPGTEHVYNMDGGGSTNACTADYGSLVTESGRPVADVFGIFSSPVK